VIEAGAKEFKAESAETKDVDILAVLDAITPFVVKAIPAVVTN
jgi:hypothetical protein